jgi:hypothetical protein
VRTSPRLVLGALAVAAVSLVASGCDTAPVAASVNGQLIKTTALNAELAQLAANPGYIAAVETAAGSISPEPGTYTTGWTAHVLTGEVIAAAVHQYLARHHDLPDAEMLTAARTVEAADYSTHNLWQAFPASYRTTLTERTAELATLEPPTAPTGRIDAAYRQFLPYFFSEVCVRQAAVTVTGTSGSVDYPASDAAARRLIATGAPQGVVACYTPASFELQPTSFTDAVLALGVGQYAAPQRTTSGYEVLQVVSRRIIPLGGDLTRALSVALEAGANSPVLDSVLARARVHVNPAYGTWVGSARTGYAVRPPSVPSA